VQLFSKLLYPSNHRYVGIEYNIPNANIHVELRKGSLHHHPVNWIPGTALRSTVQIGHAQDVFVPADNPNKT
jgi:hypothetical protein